MIDTIRNKWRELMLSEKWAVAGLTLIALAVHDFTIIRYPEIPKWELVIGGTIAILICLPWMLIESCIDVIRKIRKPK